MFQSWAPWQVTAALIRLHRNQIAIENNALGYIFGLQFGAVVNKPG
jgi:hypothetical protein